MSAPFVRARTGECSLPYGHSIPYLPENVTLFLGKRRKSVDSTKEDGFSLLTLGRKWNTIKPGGRCIPSCYRSFHSPAGVLFRRLGKHAFFMGRDPGHPGRRKPPAGAGGGGNLGFSLEEAQRWPPRREERRSLSLRSDRRLSEACMKCLSRSSKDSGSLGCLENPTDRPPPCRGA